MLQSYGKNVFVSYRLKSYYTSLPECNVRAKEKIFFDFLTDDRLFLVQILITGVASDKNVLIQGFHKCTKLAIMALMPSLYYHVFAL